MTPSEPNYEPEADPQVDSQSAASEAPSEAPAAEADVPALAPEPESATPAKKRTRRFRLRDLVGRSRQALGGAFGNASRGAKQFLTPTPEPPPVPVPPVVVHNESRLLNHSPFSIGFFGALGVLLAVGLMIAITQVQHILILVILSLFLALGLNPAVEFFTRRRIPRPVAVFGVTAVVVGILTTGIVSLVPLFTTQIQSLLLRVPYWLAVLARDKRVARWEAEYNIIDNARNYIMSGNLVQNLFGGIWGAGMLVANLIFSVIMTLVLTIYFLASLPAIKQIIYQLAPASRRARSRYLADEIFRGVSGYITGMFMIVTVASGCSFIFMNLIGLRDYSLALAFIVALFCFIPLVGSSMAMITVALVGFATSPTIGIATIIYFLIYQQLDAYLLYPTVMKHTVKVPGALVVLSALIGGILLGVIGALIAIPTAAALLLLYREVLQPHLDAS